ncbi:uncharacterized protein H6S33_008597 [Morchella sextelata]|uniref:uncharacterized protein n=1 Tax=Morchella sextelata TaxID=1174677 RepID=UPI001D0551C2|nr:uncharacterized protein H6S33_008597 [Morchella sextelata]KAH0602516.1 hypothetical protein H6S33_008597 [Morchella sextelata]
MRNFILPAAVMALMSSANAQQSAYGQCGGASWTGVTTCVSGFYCQYSNEWYSQCVAGTASTTAAAGTTSSTTAAGTTTTTRATTLATSTTTTTAASAGTGTAKVDELVGYGRAATGGGSAAATTVTSCSALESAVGASGAKVVKVSGLLSGCGIIDIESTKTILGVGSNSGLTDGGFRIKDADNVIIRNMVFAIPPEGGDLVALDGATNVWIDHCDFSTVGLTGGKDDYDGLLDITHASNLVTVSWNKFHDHWKGSLVGHSDSNASEDTGYLKVTYHHNSWININSRLPSLRFGTGHIYSSYFEDCPTSGINSRMGAQVLVENNNFNSVQLAIVTDLDSDDEGYAVQRNNVFTDSTTRITQTGSLTPPYSYTMDTAASVPGIVAAYAGTGIVG